MGISLLVWKRNPKYKINSRNLKCWVQVEWEDIWKCFQILFDMAFMLTQGKITGRQIWTYCYTKLGLQYFSLQWSATMFLFDMNFYTILGSQCFFLKGTATVRLQYFSFKWTANPNWDCSVSHLSQHKDTTSTQYQFMWQLTASSLGCWKFMAVSLDI